MHIVLIQDYYIENIRLQISYSQRIIIIIGSTAFHSCPNVYVRLCIVCNIHQPTGRQYSQCRSNNYQPLCANDYTHSFCMLANTDYAQLHSIYRSGAQALNVCSIALSIIGTTGLHLVSVRYRARFLAKKYFKLFLRCIADDYYNRSLNNLTAALRSADLPQNYTPLYMEELYHGFV